MADKCTYPLPVLIWQAILLFLLKLEARRQITWVLRTNSASVLSHLAMLTHADLSSLSSLACDDTIADAFARLSHQQLQSLIQDMVRHLIRQRTLEFDRLLGIYYKIALDATGLFHRHHRHCKHCLVTKTKSGEILYSHHVLEAKLITTSGLAFSIASEMIENVGSDDFDLSCEKGKQDCELNAFKRIVPTIKQAFPQLPICILVDSLYAALTVMNICKQYGWAFIICFKEGSIPSVYEEFNALLPLQPHNRDSWETDTVFRDLCWTTDILYHQHPLHLLKTLDRDKTTNEEKTFLHLTNLTPSKTSAREIVNQGGRQRWKIENQGFNMQKNGGYNLEHVYSEHENAANCFYLCLQIAHIINQLIEHGSLLKNVAKMFGSIKNLTAHLLDAFKFITIESADVQALFAKPFQIRLNTS